MNVKVTVTDDILSRLANVLETVLKKDLEKTEISSSNLSFDKRFGTKYGQVEGGVGSECVKLLNESLSSHRYSEAVDLLWIMCQNKSIDDDFLFKASLMVLNNLPIDDDVKYKKIVSVLRSCIYSQQILSKREVILERITQSIVDQTQNKERDGELQDSYLKIIPCLCGMEKKNPLLFNMLEGYKIYLECQKLCETASNNEDKISLDQKFLKIQLLIGKPGNWDIFVLKIVETLEKFQREEDARTLLCNYAEQQPDNLNAQIYLCLYLEKKDPSSELLVKQLKKIARLSPSDERVLLLLKKWKKKDLTILEALKIIFMFLDYPTNGKNIGAWKILRKLLKSAKSDDGSVLEGVKSFWKSRQKSWLWLHFNPSEISKLDIDNDLVSIKVKVLKLLDKNHEYIITVNKKFSNL